MTLAYLACVAVALVVLAVALRRRPVPPPVRPAPVWPVLPDTAAADISVILTAAVRLAERLAPAA